MCEAYVIPFLFGSFFMVCHPYIDVHFLKCFLSDLYKILCGLHVSQFALLSVVLVVVRYL